MIPLVVRSLDEAAELVAAGQARAVVSIVNAAYQLDEVRHDCHLALQGYDAYLPGNPHVAGARHVEAVVDFAHKIGDAPGVLVHCNWGESRSTAAAWAMLIAWGWKPADALASLRAEHPPGRRFAPNRLMVEAIDDVIGLERRPPSRNSLRAWGSGHLSGPLPRSSLR